MMAERHAFWALPAAAGLLLWPAAWNGYPMVFADTGTYLSQAIHRYLGWDRPPFYSLFMLPLHATVSTWPVIVAQALLTVWMVRSVCEVLVPWLRVTWLPVVVLPLAAGTWLPFLVCQLMPDVFTPLLVLALGVLARRRGWALTLFAAFAIAAQQSSLLLGAVLTGSVLVGRGMSLPSPCGRREKPTRLLLPLPFAIAALLAVNLIGHHRMALSPFGNVFLLARVIYDGPGMVVLRRDCPTAGWRLCPFLDRFPPISDEFLWRADSPIVLAGGHKAVSAEADAIIAAALRAEPLTELGAILGNGMTQLLQFRSGDGLDSWPGEVAPWIAQDFPPAERARYVAARQTHNTLVLPSWLTTLHAVVSVAGVSACLLLLPTVWRRRHAAAGFLVVTLVSLPVSAIITGGLSTPHDRYQSRIMWLPPFVAGLSALALLRRPA